MSEINLVEDREAVTRREFTAQSILALLSGFVITISDACSESPTTPATSTTTTPPASTTTTPATSTSTTSTPPGTSTTTTPATSTTTTIPATSTTTVPATSTTTTSAPSTINGTISANHGHTATVTGAQIAADLAVTLNIQGTAGHNHTVALSAADLTKLNNRQAVSVVSSTDSLHNHTVTFTPA